MSLTSVDGDLTDQTADTANVNLSADCTGGETIRLFGSIKGAETYIGDLLVQLGILRPERPEWFFHFDPCSVPGGSDLPGTTVAFRATAADVGTSNQTDVAKVSMALGDDTTPPRLYAVSLRLDGRTLISEPGLPAAVSL